MWSKDSEQNPDYLNINFYQKLHFMEKIIDFWYNSEILSSITEKIIDN